MVRKFYQCNLGALIVIVNFFDNLQMQLETMRENFLMYLSALAELCQLR